MMKYIKTWALGLALVLLLTLSMVQSVAAQSDPLEVARQFYAALDAGDHDKALALVDPDGIYIENPAYYVHKHSLRIFVDEVGTGAYHVVINSSELKADGTVVTDISVTGGDFTGLPRTPRATITATVQSGKITSMLAIFSDETLVELGVISQPGGMPKTGDSVPGMPVALMALAAMCSLLGLAILRGSLRAR